VLKALYDGGHTDPETSGLLAGRYKQKWEQSGYANRTFLQAAWEVYREVFERTHDSYPGINAAALALHVGEPEQGRRMAGDVLTSLDRTPVDEMDQWKLATTAEARLLIGHLDTAKRLYRKAVAKDPHAQRSIAVMRRQARLNLEALALPVDALDGILFVSKVVVFTGHTVDAPGRQPERFPDRKVPAVRHAIAKRLRTGGAGHGFSSAARGSDLLFLEELLKQGGRATVLLPFPKEDFARTSVGQGWDGRYGAVLRDPRVECAVLSPRLPSENEQPAAYAACNRQLQQDAMAYARMLDERPILLTVWNGDPTGDGAGGTADAVREWQAEGYPVEVIDLSRI
jgi:hypothetical protein